MSHKTYQGGGCNHGIEETALGVLAGLCLKALGLATFFTVGKDEVRQWLVRKDSPAPVARRGHSFRPAAGFYPGGTNEI